MRRGIVRGLLGEFLRGTQMASGIEIDYEVADKITLASLQQHLQYLQKEVRDHETVGSYMHPEDYHNSKINLIPALETLIKYYGG
jgi:hypothetical protein